MIIYKKYFQEKKELKALSDAVWLVEDLKIWISHNVAICTTVITFVRSFGFFPSGGTEKQTKQNEGTR